MNHADDKHIELIETCSERHLVSSSWTTLRQRKSTRCPD